MFPKKENPQESKHLPWLQMTLFAAGIGLFDQTHQIFQNALNEFDGNDDDDAPITLTVMQVETVVALFEGVRALLECVNCPIHNVRGSK